MKRALRIAVWICVPLLVAAGIVAGGYYWAMPWYFNPMPPAMHYPKPATALQAQQQDIDYFAKLAALDFSFSPAARAEADREIAKLKASRTVLDEPHLRVALMRIMALADNGHTMLGYNHGPEFPFLPVRVGVFSDGLYVMRAKEPYAALLGGRILAIDGHPIAEVMRKLESIRGGAPNLRRYYVATYLYQIDVLHGLDISPADRSTWTVKAPDGRTVTMTMKAYKPSAKDPTPFPERWYSVDPLKGLEIGWKTYDAGLHQPWSLEDFDNPFRRAWLPHSCVLVIQLKANHSEPGHSIEQFMADTGRAMKARKPCAIVLDNRFNGGGDYTLTHDFVQDLPNQLQPGGQIYVLTSAATFSAGITTTVFLKQAGGDSVHILGEPVGDRMAFFAEGRRGCLPHHALCVNYQRGKHDYRHTCWNPSVCYWLNWYYQPHVKSLKPEELVPMTFAAWKAGRDPAFERAVALGNR